MKSQILFALILIASMAASVHGKCSAMEKLNCTPRNSTCEGVHQFISCAKKCDMSIVSSVTSTFASFVCGASSLTNIGLPMMLLVALAVFK